MKDEIQRLENKVKNGEALTFSEEYFIKTIEFLSDVFLGKGLSEKL